MNRLRDEWGDDPVAVRGIEILRGTAPTPRMPEMKRRVWLAQQQPAARAGFAFRLSRLRVGVVVAGAILCIAGTSGAVIAARRWIMPALHEVGRPAPKVPSGAVAAAGRPRTSREPARAAEPVAPRTELGEAASPPGELPRPAAPRTTTAAAPASGAAGKASVPSPSVRISHGAGTRRTATVASGTTRLAPASGHEARAEARQASIAIPPTTAVAARERTQVLDAMIALRRDHDAVSAGTMLHHYLTAYPNGALREEALVLAIEAASARGDVALVKSLARAYQDAYPNGRFRRYAQDQATSSPS